MSGWNRRRGTVPAAVCAAALLLAGCSNAASEDETYHPAVLEELPGREVKLVRITSDAASRIDLQTAPVERTGEGIVVPYAALLYDGEGEAWVYQQVEPLAFARVPIDVIRVDDGQVVVATELDSGDVVGTVGVTELYGAELGIDGSH